MSRRPIAVVGIGADGCASLTSRAIDAVARSSVLVGGARHLAFFPQYHGRVIPIRGGVDALLEEIANESLEDNVAVLASGDPMFFGIGARIVRRFGVEDVDVVPNTSSLQWLCARVGVPVEGVAPFSAHGRSIAGLATRLRTERSLVVLTDGTNDARAIGRHLLEHGLDEIDVYLGEALGGPGESVRKLGLAELVSLETVDPLHVLLLHRPHGTSRPRIAYAEEESFERRMPKKGLITKREVRMLALASMRLRPSSVVWDIGAATGSVAIEAAMIADHGHAYAVEQDESCIEHVRANCRAHSVDNVTVIHGLAPSALEGLPDPDAIFVGGSRGSMSEIIDVGLARLRPGGRLVITAITFENVHEAVDGLRRRGYDPEVTLMQISRGVKLARYLRYEAENPIHIIAVTRGEVSA